MNDGISSHSGIPRSAFPEGVPTFSGHFHKPHTIGDGFIRYVGSPYQVRGSILYSRDEHLFFAVGDTFVVSRDFFSSASSCPLPLPPSLPPSLNNIRRAWQGAMIEGDEGRFFFAGGGGE